MAQNKFLTSILMFSVCTKLFHAVELESSLNADQLACPDELVIFTCTTSGTPILEWFSEQYIGTGRDRLQILSESDRNTSSITPDAVAVRINVTSVSGVTVIVSELRITASMKYPTATVSCSNGDQRFLQNITFRIFAVTLTSTLNAERVTYPQDIIIFTCTTRGSPILEWFSEQYIGTGRDRLQILSESDRNTSSITPDAVATRINVTRDDEIIVIVSELRIIASILYPNATISCSNGSPKNVNMTFQTIERVSDKTTEVSATNNATTFTIAAENSTTNGVNDNNLAQSRVGVIIGATVTVLVAICLITITATIVILLAVFLLTKKYRLKQRSMESEDENGEHVFQDTAIKMKEGLRTLDKEQVRYDEDKELSPTHIHIQSQNMDQDNLTEISAENKRAQVISFASTLSRESGYTSQ